MSLARKLLLILALVVGVGSSLTGALLHAQEKKEGIGISPTRLALVADPGEQLKGKFTVLNAGSEPIDYKVYVKDFRIRNEEYEKDFEPVEGAVSPASWITVPEDEASLQPGEQRELDYTITVPEDAVPRGYYAVIFAETLPKEADATGVARVKRVGSLVYLTVKGGSVEKGELASFDAATWQRERPVTSTIRIQNDGNVHFDVTGSMRLKDIFGRTVSQTEVTGTILPATIRKFSPELHLSQPFGIYKVEGDVTFLGNTTQLSPKWVVVGAPFWIVLWAVIIIGWTVVLIRWIRRRRAKRKEK